MLSDEFVKGWQAAREYWSRHHGSLSPYPPGEEPVFKAPEPPKAAKTASIGETKPKRKTVKESSRVPSIESES